MRSAEQAVKSGKVIPLPRRRDWVDLAFLPAALEIVETPPSPTGRAIGLTIIALFALGLAWASLGTVDIIASAPGKLIPSGRTKVIQPFETGVVRAIHVRDGQSVAAGEVLIELDPTMNEAERNHLRSDLTSAQLDAARLRAALSEATDPLSEFQPPAGAPEKLVAMQRHFLQNQAAEFSAKIASLDQQRAQKEAERTTIAATIAKLDAMIPLIEQRLRMRKESMEKALGSKITYLETLQQFVEQQQEREVQQSHYHEAQAAIAALVETRAQAKAEHGRTLSSDLVEAERKVSGLAEDLVKAEQRTRLQALTTPTDGVVQQLAVHTVGGVVTPAQALLAVVPAESQIEIEAMISNRDIGFVHPGQQAEIKIDTFPFTRYGLLHGTVLSVSQDAIVRDKPSDPTGSKIAGAEGSSSEPKGQELVYAARVSLDRTKMQIDDNVVNLTPGMAVTVEIKTGSRTVISYLLSPLMRYKHESLRER
jgi:hemolysin D